MNSSSFWPWIRNKARALCPRWVLEETMSVRLGLHWPTGCLALWLVVGCNEQPRFAAGGAPPPPVSEQALPTVVPEPQPSVEPSPSPTLEPPPPTPSIEPVPAFASLEWNLSCTPEGQSPAEAELPVGGDARVFGPGPHAFAVEELSGVPLMVSGSLCAPAVRPRRVVVVLDVSGSMEEMIPRLLKEPTHRGNDPLNSTGSCGRLDAVRALMRSFGATQQGVGQSGSEGQAQFALVTFADGVEAASPHFFSTEEDLFADLVARADNGGDAPRDINQSETIDIADILCAGGGGTNYEAGLNRAQDLLRSTEGGEGDYSREVYFVSDGQPNAGKEGVGAAQAIRDLGGIVATMMLKGDEQVLKNQIASRDSLGVPYHAFVQNADQLSQALKSLAENTIEDGFVEIRAMGGTYAERFRLNLMDDGVSFRLPVLALDMASAPQGLKVVIEYWDRGGELVSSSGQILWKVP